MSKNAKKLDALAAMMDKAVQDDPHTTSPKKTKPLTKSRVEKSTAKNSEREKGTSIQSKEKTKVVPLIGGRERTGVTLTPSAVKALKQIQAFLMIDCGAKSSVSSSAAVCVALETTAEILNEKKEQLASLYEEHRMLDGRGRKTT